MDYTIQYFIFLKLTWLLKLQEAQDQWKSTLNQTVFRVFNNYSTIFLLLIRNFRNNLLSRENKIFVSIYTFKKKAFIIDVRIFISVYKLNTY